MWVKNFNSNYRFMFQDTNNALFNRPSNVKVSLLDEKVKNK